jgi:ABC-2 type transport system permease protein
MRQLIIKDFVLQKRTAYVYLAMGMLFFFYFDAMDQRNMIAVMMPTFMIIYGFMNRSLSEDEKNHTLRMLVSLPIPRATIVKAKYASVALAAALAGSLLLSIGALAGIYSFQEPEDRVMNLLIIAAFTLTCTLLVSVFIPLVYKIGVVRAQSINRFMFFGLFALGTTVGTLAGFLADRLHMEGEPPAWVNGIGKIGSVFAEMNPYAGIVLLFALSGLIYIVSMLLSIRFLERREVF